MPTRVIFDKVPETLRARPTLSVNVEAATAGPRQAKLSYLTSGLSWKADYVALFDEAKGALDLQVLFLEHQTVSLTGVITGIMVL